VTDGDRQRGSSSTWAPLRIGVFRMMWLVALASNIATWMQTVGAQWMLVHGPHPAFLEAMIAVRLSRLRTGATDWGLLHVLDSPDSFTESFTVPTWEEHVRQQTERVTGTDQEFLLAADAFSDPAPRVVHLSVVELPERR
jgi:Transmembrane secretion effector